ncbi:MAG: nuclear transport factor 2 family protein [Bacteroidales bacterium]|jgi:ketosteroid isomerase-like protein|nr:nuclear transport factor 2 family protein [Bacteroidales bacterium]
MKRNVHFIILLTLVFSSAIFAQNDVKTDNKEIRKINRVLDSWHERAAVADTTYFEMFADNAMYLGTDAKEIWTAQEFEDLYMSYFKRGTAWNFKKKDRNVYLGDFGHYAWVDESLDTWMGLCRGTAVMEKNQAGEWRIKHYSLTVLVSNDLIREYVKLLNRDE